MKKIVLLLTTILILLALNACSGQAENEKKQNAAQKGIPVKILELKPQAFSQFIRVPGTVRANNQIKLVAEQPGTLEHIYKKRGEFVNKGDVIAVLTNEILQASLQDALAARDQAELTFNSNKALFAKKAISENQFKSARLALQRANAALEMAKSRVDKLQITAPISGYVNERYPDLGAYITPGSPLFELVDNSRFTIRANIAERFIVYVQKGAAVDVGFDALPQLRLKGKVTFVARSINPQNRTFAIEVALPGHIDALRPYMVANLRVLKESSAESIVIPLDAIIESETGRYVYLDEHEQAVKQKINIGEISGDRVLTDSLRSGQRLIVLGQRQISAGDTLQVIR